MLLSATKILDIVPVIDRSSCGEIGRFQGVQLVIQYPPTSAGKCTCRALLKQTEKFKISASDVSHNRQVVGETNARIHSILRGFDANTTVVCLCPAVRSRTEGGGMRHATSEGVWEDVINPLFDNKYPESCSPRDRDSRYSAGSMSRSALSVIITTTSRQRQMAVMVGRQTRVKNGQRLTSIRMIPPQVLILALNKQLIWSRLTDENIRRGNLTFPRSCIRGAEGSGNRTGENRTFGQPLPGKAENLLRRRSQPQIGGDSDLMGKKSVSGVHQLHCRQTQASLKFDKATA